MLTGIGFGLVPALQISKTDVQEALKEGGGSGESPRRSWLRSLLVVGEIASAVVLLIGAGLLIASFARLQRTDPGLRPENVLTLRISLPETKYEEPPAAAAFSEPVLDRVSALPGGQSAGVVNLLPLQRTGTNGSFEIEGQEPFPLGNEPLAEFRAASPDYFDALGIPLLAGRFFDVRDRADGGPVAIVNQTLARQYVLGQDPVG